MSITREQKKDMLRHQIAELNDTSVDCMMATYELQHLDLEDALAASVSELDRLRAELAELRMDKARLIEQLGLIADKADNFLCAAKLPMPPHVHVIGLKGGMEDIAKAARSAMSAPAGGKNDKT